MRRFYTPQSSPTCAAPDVARAPQSASVIADVNPHNSKRMGDGVLSSSPSPECLHEPGRFERTPKEVSGLRSSS
jgi:hypothetical protein